MEIKAIETEYGGCKFRSRLEARWAVLFDELGIAWEYEPEGYEFEDGTRYLPDFYFPDSNQYFEVKGIMKETDMTKIQNFIKSGHDISVGFPSFTFRACSEYPKQDGDEEGVEYWLDEEDTSEINECQRCGRRYFMGGNGCWTCRCCGIYTGDGRKILAFGDGDTMCVDKKENAFIKAVIKANHARFEHGEKPKGR